MHSFDLFSGGWLLVANIVADTSPFSTVHWALQKSYHQISEYGSNNLRLAQSGLMKLRSQLNFTQLRFYCRKLQSGRTFHVATVGNKSGEAVVQYFSGQTDVMPESCDSFRRMDDDNSVLSMNCDRWGNDNGDYVGKWGHYKRKNEKRMYDHAAFVAHKNLWVIGSQHQLCDDKTGDYTLSPGDFWKVYVR